MGNFRGHLRNGLKDLVLYSSVRQTKFIETSLREELHLTFDNLQLRDEKETEDKKICSLLIDFGDIKVDFKLTFEKKKREVQNHLKLKDKPKEYYIFRLIEIE